MSALNHQEDGHHYTDMKMQPIELAYAMQASPAFTKVAKYVTRIKDEPVSQLNKALHCVALEEELVESFIPYPILCDADVSWELICEFTDDINLQHALQAMYHRMYDYAKISLEAIKDKLKDRA